MDPNAGQSQGTAQASSWNASIVIHLSGEADWGSGPGVQRSGLGILENTIGIDAGGRAVVSINQMMPLPAFGSAPQVVPANIRTSPVADSPEGAVGTVVKRHIAAIAATAMTPGHHRLLLCHRGVKGPCFDGAGRIGPSQSWIRQQESSTDRGDMLHERRAVEMNALRAIAIYSGDIGHGGPPAARLEKAAHYAGVRNRGQRTNAQGSGIDVHQQVACGVELGLRSAN